MRRLKPIALALAAGVAVMLVYLLGVVTQPAWLEARWIRLTSPTLGEAYERLTEVLRVGMTPGEVRRLVGEPDGRLIEGQGVTWLYMDETGLPGMIVQFYGGDHTRPPQPLRVCYFVRDTEAITGSFPPPAFWPTGRPLAEIERWPWAAPTRQR